MSAAAVEAFREEADISGSLRLGSTLPRGTTAGRNGRKYQGLVAVVVEDEDAVPPKEDRPPGVKNQVPSVTATAIQVDQPKHAPVKVPLGQPSGTPLPQAAIQADRPQRLPVQTAREVRVFVPTVAMPDPLGRGAPRFNGKDISKFIKDYEGMCRRYYVGEERRLACLPDYCKDIYAEAIQMMPEFHEDWSWLVT